MTGGDTLSAGEEKKKNGCGLLWLCVARERRWAGVGPVLVARERGKGEGREWAEPS